MKTIKAIQLALLQSERDYHEAQGRMLRKLAQAEFDKAFVLAAKVKDARKPKKRKPTAAQAQRRKECRVACAHPECSRSTLLTAWTRDDLIEAGTPWMCVAHDEMRTLHENAEMSKNYTPNAAGGV